MVLTVYSSDCGVCGRRAGDRVMITGRTTGGVRKALSELQDEVCLVSHFLVVSVL